MGFTKGVPFSHFLLFVCTFLLICQSKSASGFVERTVHMVQMDMPSMPKVFIDHHNWYSSIITCLESANPPPLDNHQSSPSLLHTYEHAFGGFTALLSKYELEVLKKIAGYVSAHYEYTSFTLHTTYTPQFLSLNPTTGLWPASKYGQDVIVGVIDSGVWPESKSFDDRGISATITQKWKGKCEVGQDFDSSMCNAKLIGARSFNKHLREATPGLRISMNSARDTNGHGTMISSIVAGNYVNGSHFLGYALGTASGVAPRARLAIYKIDWDEGHHLFDVVTAIDQAVKDGVDIINLSLGVNPELIPLSHDVLAASTFLAAEKGVLISTAAGNTGKIPTTLNNGYPWVLTVTASTTDRWFLGTLNLGGILTVYGWTIFPGIDLVQDLLLLHDPTLSACSNILSNAPAGIIICHGGPDPLQNQLDNMQQSKVQGAIFVLNTSVISAIEGVDHMLCACILIGPKEGDVLFNHMKDNLRPRASMEFFHRTLTGISTAPTVVSYASRGPSPTFPCILKPDVMAPGSFILGAWPPNKQVSESVRNLFAINNLMSGTSVSCPHASGVAALLKGAHPEWSPAAIISAIITSANAFDNVHDPIKDNESNLKSAATPLAMGAGQINPNQALDPGLIYDATPQDYVNLLCSMKALSHTKLWDLVKEKYDCSSPSTDLNYPSFIVLYPERISHVVKVFQRTVTNVGPVVVTYKVRVVPPHRADIKVFPETLEFTHKNEKKSYNVTISYRGKISGQVESGELVWYEEKENHKVRSPIVIAHDVKGKSTDLC